MTRTHAATVVAVIMAAALRAAGAPQAAFPQEIRVVSPAGWTSAAAASPAIMAGPFLYISAQDGRERGGHLPGTNRDQVKQAFQNVSAVVDAAGLSLAHVVYAQVYVADVALLDDVEREWRTAFPSAPPARAVVGVHSLPAGAAIAITAVAYRDLAGRTAIVPPGSEDLPFSAGIRAGHRVFLSAATGIDPHTRRLAADPDAQVDLALDGMAATLTRAGLDMRHVVFVNPYLAPGVSRRMNETYARRFEFGDTPARATISVSALPHGATIAFTGVAVDDLALRRAYRPRNMRPSATASPCVMAEDTYYCSAKGPFTPGPIEGPGRLQGIWAGTLAAQVRQTMRNLIDGLEEADLGLGDVVATTVYLDDMDDEPEMARVYGPYFATRPPSRTTVAQIAPGSRAPRNDDTYPQLEQISLIAVRPPS